MRKNRIAAALLASAMVFSLAGCQDTKARQENEQLKTHVAELEKENADLGNRVDGLAKENSALASENEKLKASQAPAKKNKKGKRKHSSKRSSSTSD